MKLKPATRILLMLSAAAASAPVWQAAGAAHPSARAQAEATRRAQACTDDAEAYDELWSVCNAPMITLKPPTSP